MFQKIKEYWWEIIVGTLIAFSLLGIYTENVFKAGYRYGIETADKEHEAQ